MRSGVQFNSTGVEAHMREPELTTPSCRSFLTRTQMYQRALAMTKRLFELKDQHGWTSDQVNLAVKLIDEPFISAMDDREEWAL